MAEQADEKKPKKRRGYGEGSIHKRQDGRWIGQLTGVRGPDGVRRRATVYGKTKQEVTDKLIELRIAQRMQGATTSESMTITEWGVRWFAILDDEVTIGAIESSTRDGYEADWENHVVPELGGWKLEELTTPLIQAWLAKKSRDVVVRGGPRRTGEGKGHRSKNEIAKRQANARRRIENPSTKTRSYSSLKGMLAALRRSLQDAKRDNRIPYNPAMDCKLPGGKRAPATRVTGHTKEEMKLLWPAMAADARRSLWLALFMLAARIGEILELRWSRINLANGEVYFGANVRRQKRRDGSPLRTERVVSDSKGHKLRLLKLPEVLHRELIEHHARQQEQIRAFNEHMAAVGSPLRWADQDLVFTTDIGTQLDDANLRAAWQRVATSVGVARATPHRLRHTGATIIVRSGLPIEFAREYLGHSDDRTTRGYLDPNLDQAAASAAAMDAYARALEETQNAESPPGHGEQQQDVEPATSNRLTGRD